MAIQKWIVQVVLDVLSLFLVCLPYLILQTSVKPYRRGFFCNDNSIRYPYKEDTVTYMDLTVASFLVSFFVFAVTEGFHFALMLKSGTQPARYRLSNSCTVPRYFLMLYRTFGIFLFGLAVQQSITNVGKLTIGRLRPHFMSVCMPNFTAINCTSGESSNQMYLYIEGDVCTAPDSSHHRLKEARMSFPSGHSSFAAYVAVFLVLYLQACMTWRGSKLLRHFLQVVMIYLAIYVCLSRVSDYKHHWSDVLGGAILGVFVAALTGIHVSDQFSNYWKRSSSDLQYVIGSTAINPTDNEIEET